MTNTEQPHPEDFGDDPEVPLDLLHLYEVLEWQEAIGERGDA